jgi:hypothetical protein
LIGAQPTIPVRESDAAMTPPNEALASHRNLPYIPSRLAAGDAAGEPGQGREAAATTYDLGSPSDALLKSTETLLQIAFSCDARSSRGIYPRCGSLLEKDNFR